MRVASTDGEFSAICQAANPIATATVPAIANQPAQARSRAGAGRPVGQRAGTRCSTFTASPASSGAPISSIGTGANAPAASSGRPGSSQAATARAGSTVSLASP